MSEYNALVITDRSQAEIIAQRRKRRADMLAEVRRRTAITLRKLEGERNMTQFNVNIRKLHADAVIPAYATDGSAGFDMVAVEDVIIAPGETKRVPTGLAFEIPPGYVMIVCMRSGIALKTKLRQPNGIGVIDSDYRGEVAMMFDNVDADIGVESPCYTRIDGVTVRADELYPDGTYIIRKGDRVAQAFIQPLPRATFTVVDELSETDAERAASGVAALERR